MSVELSSRVQRDLRKIQEADRARLFAALKRLDDPSAQNLDVKTLAGKSPFLRMRVGDWRVIYYPQDSDGVWLVARVINRRDLDAAVKTL